MEDNCAAAASATSVHAEKHVAVPAEVATTNGGGGDADEGKGAEDLSPAAPALPCGPRKTGLHLFVMNIRSVFKLDELGSEVLRIAVPASLALAADPLASLVDTAFIGRLGSVEIAAVGVSIAIFNQVSKVCIYPLVSVTTSFVAEEDAIISKVIEENNSQDLEKASHVDPEANNLHAPVVGDATNIILDPILMFVCHMGVTGAAVAHVTSQYLITLILMCRLVQQVDVIPPSIKSLKFGRFLGCGFLLLARVVAVTFCVTLAASLAARQGPTIMAGFQICCQLWLATSLLADGLAVAGQAVLASAFAKNDNKKVVAATSRVLQLSIVLGMVLTVVLGLAMRFGAGIFTKDQPVIEVIHKGIPFVAGTQTINSLAFVFDGINFGASDYTYSAYSMVAVASVSIPCLVYLSAHNGFIGIWIALTIYMSLRTIASTWRMGAARGPWTFLRK
nr:unnamed protein product [Digitaria exilis]